MLRVISFVLTIVCAWAQQGATTIAIERVEHGLLSPVRVVGEPIERYDMTARMERHRVPGVSIAVIDNYDIVWAKGYGFRDRESKLPVDKDTLFEAGSISKPVAATGALWLVDHQKLSLDEDVNIKLKSWHVPENDFTKSEKVTLRRLLSYSAGLTIHGFPGYEAGVPVPSVPQVLDGAKPANTAAVRVDMIPGTQWRYSGGGYTVMQLLVTDVTGTTFPDFMSDTVLRKIGMDHSTYEQPLPSKLREVAATAYKNGSPIPGKYHTYPEMAAAGLWTNASDLARFGIEIMKSAQGRANHVLTQQTTRLMLTKQSDNYGLGFSLEGAEDATRFSHGGVDEGFEAMLLCYETGKGAVVMTNAQGGTALISEILLSIAAEYRWPAYRARERNAIKLTPEVLHVFAGRYTSNIGDIRVTLGDHGLEVAFDGAGARLAPESDTRFFALSAGIPDLTFEKDSSGKVTGFRAGGVRATKVE